jgi:hypothetical protein
MDVLPEVLSRIEEKFVIPARLKPWVLQLIERHLKPLYPDTRTRFTLVESIYFDTDSLGLFVQHFTSPARRFKLRTRRYGPNGIWSHEEAMVELKAKEGRLSRKDRILVGHEQYVELFRGAPIQDLLTRKIKEANPELQGSIFKPRCRIAYLRHAFEKNGVRVTLDDNLEFQSLAPVNAQLRDSLSATPSAPAIQVMRDRFVSGEQVILELKHLGERPAWLSEFLATHSIRNASFSKYCYAMAQELLALPKPFDDIGSIESVSAY